MATARKRGDSWRCLAYIGTVDGKRKYKSFTAATKQEAEQLAANYERQAGKAVTVRDAILKYIELKEAVLSPSTITCYKSYEKNRFDDIGDKNVSDLTDRDVQKWISDMTKDGKSPKYIRNVYGLLSSAVRLQMPQKAIRGTLPTKAKKYSYVPTAAEIWQIMPYLDEEMQIAAQLAAFCSLRIGEICALTSADLHGNEITINKALARSSSGEYVLKQPKTAGSTRTVTVPSFLLEKMQKVEGKYIHRSPMMVSNNFHKVARRNGFQFRFHDLRHFFASELAKSMPLAVVERMGGWSPGSPVLRQIYIGAQEAEMQKNMAAATAIFEKMQPQMQPCS